MAQNDEFDEETKSLLRELAKERDRRKWLGELLKRWAQWITAISLAATVLQDAVGKLYRYLTGP